MGGEERFPLAAYAVITNTRGDVLLTRRREGNEWVLPGGSLEGDEAPWETVGREVHEETGLDLAEVRLVGVYTKRSERDLVFVFRAAGAHGTPRTSDERDRVEFVDPRRLPEATSDRDRERIEDALAARAVPVLKVQPSDADEPPPGAR